MKQPYTQTFFAEQQDNSYPSAREIVPVVMQLIAPKSVIDIGCGVGAWLAAFRDEGVEEVAGVDGDYVDRTLLMIRPEQFASHDLNTPFRGSRRYDLAISLEVGEHLVAAGAVQLVDTLVALAPVVLFSAAVPSQGGVAHMNEQWPDYWIERFGARDYWAVDCIRRRIWGNANVRWWYAQNTFIFVERNALKDYPALREELERGSDMPLRAVHPGMYQGLRACTDPRTMSARAAWRQFVSATAGAVRRRLGQQARQ